MKVLPRDLVFAVCKRPAKVLSDDSKNRSARRPHLGDQPLSHRVQISGIDRAPAVAHAVVVTVEHLNGEIRVTMSQNIANYGYALFHWDQAILGAEQKERRYAQHAQRGHRIVS